MFQLVPQILLTARDAGSETTAAFWGGTNVLVIRRIQSEEHMSLNANVEMLHGNLSASLSQEIWCNCHFSPGNLLWNTKILIAEQVEKDIFLSLTSNCVLG